MPWWCLQIDLLFKWLMSDSLWEETKSGFPQKGSVFGALMCALVDWCQRVINQLSKPGGWFNIQMSTYQHRKSNCGDKTILRLSYLHNGTSYTGKIASLNWIRALTSLKYPTLPSRYQWVELTLAFSWTHVQLCSRCCEKSGLYPFFIVLFIFTGENQY